MKYTMARCQLCLDWFKLCDVAFAFRLGRSSKLAGPKHVLERVDLDGRQPWFGIAIICRSCNAYVRTFGATPADPDLLTACNALVMQVATDVAEIRTHRDCVMPGDDHRTRVVAQALKALARARGLNDTTGVTP